MKRSKRAVALLLAWAMVLTLAWGSGSLALAGELDDAAAEQSVVTEQEDAAQEEPAEESAPGEESVESGQEPSAPVQEESFEEPAELPPVEGEAETPAQATGPGWTAMWWRTASPSTWTPCMATATRPCSSTTRRRT